MKSVLISIQPYWCELIASGKKTIEVRKTRPKIDTPFKAYIYCTRGKDILAISKYPDKSVFLWDKSDVDRYNADMVRNGKVIGEFVCDRISPIYYTLDGLADVVDCNTSCLNPKDFIEYGKGKTLYGWHISDLVIYDKPKELSEFINYDRCPYGGLIDCKKCEEHHCLKRPPQSWCYVEVQ